MSLLFQAGGAIAIALGLIGTWLVPRHESGWLVCIVSSALWLPALVTGTQWVAVFNCGLSMAICARNYRARPVSQRRRGSDVDVDVAADDWGRFSNGELQTVRHGRVDARR